MNLNEEQRKKIKDKALLMALCDYFCNVNDEGWPDDPIDFLQRANSDYHNYITISGDEPNYDDPEAEYMIVADCMSSIITPLQLLEMVQDRAYSIETNFYNLLINIEKVE